VSAERQKATADFERRFHEPSAGKNFCSTYEKSNPAVKDLPDAAAKGENLQWK